MERFFPCRASLWSESKSYDCHLSSKTGTFDIAYGKTNTISRPSYLKDVLIVGGRLEIGFLIYFPRNSSEYYQVSNSGILESVSVDNKNISLVLGAEGYGSSLLCSYIVL